jgi:hypothetical protein
MHDSQQNTSLIVPTFETSATALRETTSKSQLFWAEQKATGVLNHTQTQLTL